VFARQANRSREWLPPLSDSTAVRERHSSRQRVEINRPVRHGDMELEERLLEIGQNQNELLLMLALFFSHSTTVI
jgi:hypothetical protein